MIEISNTRKERVKLPCLNMITVGRAYELLRADLQEQLRVLQKEIGFQYCRFHGVFHDDLGIVVKRADGAVGYQWYQLDRIYDFLLSVGLKPFVELNSMPAAIASGSKTLFKWKMNVTPPLSMELWYDLVYSFVRHVTDRYGAKEVATWYFEVWNEPNLPGFWSGTQEEYFALYQASAKAVKAVNPEYKVGGPASSSGCWISDFIHFCVDTGTPADFVSTHIYPQDEYCKYPDRKGSPYPAGHYLEMRVQEIYEEVRNSGMPDLEIHWTEWNTQSKFKDESITWTHNKAVDMLFSASYIVRNMIAVRGLCDSMAYWVASDIFEESGLKQSPFSCTYGLMTVHGIRKASYHAFYLLNKLRGMENVVTKQDGPYPEGCGIYSAYENGCYRAIVWNNRYPETDVQPDWEDEIHFCNLQNKPHMLLTARIAEENGSAYESWVRMGKPANLSEMQQELLEAHSVMRYDMAVLEGKEAVFPFCLRPNEVMYLEVSEWNGAEMEKGEDNHSELRDLNERLMTNQGTKQV